MGDGKSMVKDIHVDGAEMIDENGGVWELRYYVRAFDSESGQVIYGVKIEKVSKSDQKERQQEASYAIAESYDDAAFIAKKLADGAATPIALYDLIDEFVG